MTFAFLAILAWSMVTTQSMHSSLLLRIHSLILLLRHYLLQAVTLVTMLSVMDVTRYVYSPDFL
jgi:hypothetical protein